MSSSEIKLITIDGPAASGKSSLSALLAQKLGWQWLSTGVFYRGLAYLAISQKQLQESKILELINKKKWEVILSEDNTLFTYKKQDITSQIYTNEVDVFASELAGRPAVRKALLENQRAVFKKNSEGLIAEGRDCGTVIFPTAPLKIYLTAGDNIRAERRADQRGLSPEHIITLQKKRDEQDTFRSISPLKQPEGAMVIDTGLCSFSEMAEAAYQKASHFFCL